MRLEVQAAIAKMPNAKNMGDIMDLVRVALDVDEAQAIKVSYIARINSDHPNVDALDIANQNIGYCSGYYDRAEAKRLLDLYDCSHPIFGRSHTDGSLTTEEAFEMGRKRGEASRTQGPPDADGAS